MDKFGEFLEYLKENDIKKAVITKKETINYFWKNTLQIFQCLFLILKKTL